MMRKALLFGRRLASLAAKPLRAVQLRKLDAAVRKWREWEVYQPDVIRTPAQTIHIDSVLPSEPPTGIDYHFCPTGYFTNGRDRNLCVIPTQWRNVDNYCHWMLSELPLIHLAMESGAKTVAMPKALLRPRTSYQVRSWEVLREIFPNVATRRFRSGMNGIVPVNHDTSSSRRLIGQCEYRYYHHVRATPYTLEMFGSFRQRLRRSNDVPPKRVYINRTTRRLNNEEEIQAALKRAGFAVVTLEQMTLDQQCQLFSGAEIVVGFHGAGLTNLVFAGPQTRVIEIVDRDCVSPCYLDGVVIPGQRATRTYFHMIAAMRGMEYSCIESEMYVMDPDRLVAACGV